METLEPRTMLAIEPTISLVTSPVVEEGSAAAVIVLLSKPTTIDVSVNVATSDGTAQSPADYEATHQLVWIAAGQTSATVQIATHQDRIEDGDETFTVVLVNPTNATLAPASSATVTITDVPVGTAVGANEQADSSGPDEAPILLVQTQSLLGEGEGGGNGGNVGNGGLPTISIIVTPAVNEGQLVDVTIVLSHASNKVVSVEYSTADSSAESPVDYLAMSGTVRFQPGETTSTLQVITKEDGVVEGDETFTGGD
jgi:hypothetical protein